MTVFGATRMIGPDDVQVNIWSEMPAGSVEATIFPVRRHVDEMLLALECMI